jgi:hypothetical protein
VDDHGGSTCFCNDYEAATEGWDIEGFRICDECSIRDRSDVIGLLNTGAW